MGSTIMAIDFADTGHLRFSRRQFGTLLGAGYVSALISCQAADTPPTPAIEAILRDFFESEPLPRRIAPPAVAHSRKNHEVLLLLQVLTACPQLGS